MPTKTETIFTPTPTALTLVEKLRQRLRVPDFVARHRKTVKAFRRQCVLTFPVLVLFILQKTAKSLQVHLHEFLGQWYAQAGLGTVTPGAVTHARAKLRHQAYVELNAEVLLPTVYGVENHAAVRRWKGHRLLGVDSSLVRLPATEPLFTAFGRVERANQNGKSSVVYSAARVSILYDVLNHLGWDARLAPYTTAETELARQHLPHTRKGDLLLCDRGYAGFFWFALLLAADVDFVVRCGQGSFTAVQELFRRNQADLSVELVLPARPDLRKDLRQAKLPFQLRIRLVTVRLPTGELEVLATSLLDAKRYPTEEFVQVYHWRWGIETYYGRLKGRLELENWSGQTEEAIRQDFHATVLLSNLESVLSQGAEAQLAHQSAERKQPVQINRAVSLHAVKNQIIALLAGRQPAEKVLRQLQRLFLANPVSVRKERKVPRQITPSGQAYHYQRNVKKIVF